MVQKLSVEQKSWVDKTLDSMTLQECIGQVLMPHHPFQALQTDFQAVMKSSTEDWLRLIDNIPLGGMCVRMPPSQELKAMLGRIQSESKIPIIVGANVEPGASIRAIGGRRDGQGPEAPDYAGTAPPMMGFGAADDPNLTYETCRLIAEQRRSYGFHWTFAPVIDLNLNFRNPVTNMRSLGDDTDKVLQQATEFIRGFQHGGLMAATAKHFPGDGTDERDQHLLTTSNHLSLDEWWTSYGKIWKSVIDMGVNAVMVGHIAFPAYEQRYGGSEPSLPGTLSSKIQTELLREELGFQGVIISDASPMTGITSRVNPSDRAIENIRAGADMCLLPETMTDFGLIEGAVRDGRLNEDRIRDSVKRILEMKSRLSLHEDVFMSGDTEYTSAQSEQIVRAVAEKSITALRTQENRSVALNGSESVLFVNVFVDAAFTTSNLDILAGALQSEGCTVEQLENPTDTQLQETLPNYDAVFVNICHIPMSGSFGQIGAGFSQSLWRILHLYHDRVTYTCFGTPYVMYEMPHVPNMLFAYGASQSVQLAVAKVWLGKSDATGTLPVKEPR